ncbi:MAG: molybdopterin-dependent oxidoreductase [Roseovarius sp.]|nr:molybdopterin-dependent oxidoreductase [Roseovarius sp.]
MFFYPLRLFGICLLATSCLFPAPHIKAADSTSGPGRTLLTLEWPGSGGRDNRVELSLPDLKALPAASFETPTIWTAGVQRFTGVRLHDLLEAHDIASGQNAADGVELALHAINDYRVFVPLSEIRADGALVAYERNGAPMSRRQKGPLWVVFDYDSDPDLRRETIYTRSIWQLDRIVVSR